MGRSFVALAAALIIASPAFAADVVGGRAVLEWTRSSGPVESYIVYEARNGSGYTAVQTSSSRRYTVRGNVGERVQVRVLATGRDGGQLIYSRLSDPSEVIRFVSAPPTNPPPTNPPPTNPPPSGPIGQSGFAIGTEPLSSSRVLHFPADGDTVRSSDGRLVGLRTDARPLYCNLDGDRHDELVIGYGPGSAQLVTILDDASRGHRRLAEVDPKWWDGNKKKRRRLADKKRWKRLFQYAGHNGEVNLTCGDFDGDGRDEIIGGLGAAGFGWGFYIDDSSRKFASTQLRLGNVSDGSTRPAAADIDGDGRDELVIGFGPGTNNSMFVVDDQQAGFAVYRGTPHGRGWITFPEAAYADVNGETRPVGCDIDGDGRDELVIGLGIGGGGRAIVLDDARQNFRFRGTYSVNGMGSYRGNNGETWPSCGDLDGDGEDEIAIGLGAGGDGQVQLLESDGRPLRNRFGANGSGIVRVISGGKDRATRPAVAR